MSIYFKGIRWQNFLSTGNQWTEVRLDRHSTNLVVGENGSGKSTMLDAILFALYGRPFRNINKPKLVNSIIGKNCLVELEFRTKDKNYFIRRGIKPSIFEVYCDDQLVDQNASSREYQEYLEKYVLQMSYKSFTQIVVIGSANFVPFMQLRANERREVIEDLLDIQIFSKMLVLLKEKISLNKERLIDCKYQVDLVNQRIELVRKHIEEMRNIQLSNRATKEAKIEQLNKDLEKNNKMFKQLNDKIKELNNLTTDFDSLNTRIEKLNKIEYDIKSKIKRATDHISFFQGHDECPTCMQDIDGEFKIKFIQGKAERKDELENSLVGVQQLVWETSKKLEKIAEVQKEISKLNNDAFKISTGSSLIQSQVHELQSELLEENASPENDTEVDRKELTESKEKLKELNGRYRQLIEQQETYNVASSILKDGGIKSQIIKQYVPIINKLMNKYLSQLEFFVQFELDENFNEAIRSRYRDDFQYENFSEGEKARLDLALLFTWRAISKLRNSTATNLLIMDEVFDGSLDDEGTGYLLNILSSMGEETNVFVISHKGHNLLDKFENVLEFKKEKNFSQLNMRGV